MITHVSRLLDCSGLSWDKPAKQFLLPISDTWRVQIYPVQDHAGHEDIVWQHGKGKTHHSAFPKFLTQGWHPVACGWHSRQSCSWGMGTTHSQGYEMKQQSAMPYQILKSRQHEKNLMVDAERILCGASYLWPTVLLWLWYTTETPPSEMHTVDWWCKTQVWKYSGG